MQRTKLFAKCWIGILLGLFCLALTHDAQAQSATHNLTLGVSFVSNNATASWTDNCVYNSIPSGSTATLSGTLYFKLYKPNGTLVDTKFRGGAVYNSPSGAALPISGNTTWTISGTNTITNLTSYVDSVYQTKLGVLPPAGTYTIEWLLNTTTTVIYPGGIPETFTGTTRSIYPFLVTR